MPSPAITARSMVRVMPPTLTSRPRIGTGVSLYGRLVGAAPLRRLRVEEPEALEDDRRVGGEAEAGGTELRGEDCLVVAAPAGHGPVPLPLRGRVAGVDVAERDDVDVGGDDERPRPARAV